MHIGLGACAVRWSTTKCAVAIQVIELAVHQTFAVTFLGVDEVLIILFIHFGVGGWESWVDVLRSCLVLGCLALLSVVDEGLLDRSVFIQSTAHEVGGIWKIDWLSSWMNWHAMGVILAMSLLEQSSW